MWILIGAVAIVVLGLAAFAGLGKFGEMPGDAVNDRPKGHLPEGPVSAQLLAELRLPTASSGYDTTEVDRYLREIADGTAAPAADTFFTVVRRGYDMQAVDEIIERPRYERPTARVDPSADGTSDAEAAPDEPQSDPDNVSHVAVIELGEEADEADLSGREIAN